MQLRNLAFVAVLGTVGFMMAGCPEDAVTSSTCSTNADCIADSEVCNTAAGVCMQTCTQDSDCPGNTFACGALPSTGNVSVCQCSTDAGCNADRETADLVCDQDNGACVQRCTETSCGTGLSCNSTTGVCEANGQVGSTCSGTAQSTCAYGNFCSGSACAAAPVAPANCENFATNRPSWDPATSGGPVIYSVERGTYQVNSSFCQSDAPDAFIVNVRAYRTDVDWPATRSGLSGFFYVNTSAGRFNIIDSGLLVPNTGYTRDTANPRNATFQVYLCRPSGSTSIQTGFFFTGGNPVCQQINR